MPDDQSEKIDYQHSLSAKVDYQELRDARRNPPKEQRHESCLSREEIREMFDRGREATERIFDDIRRFKGLMWLHGPHADPYKVLLEMQAEHRKQRRLEELWEDEARQQLAWFDAHYDKVMADSDARYAEYLAILNVD